MQTSNHSPGLLFDSSTLKALLGDGKTEKRKRGKVDKSADLIRSIVKQETGRVARKRSLKKKSGANKKSKKGIAGVSIGGGDSIVSGSSQLEGLERARLLRLSYNNVFEYASIFGCVRDNVSYLERQYPKIRELVRITSEKLLMGFEQMNGAEATSLSYGEGFLLLSFSGIDMEQSDFEATFFNALQHLDERRAAAAKRRVIDIKLLDRENRDIAKVSPVGEDGESMQIDHLENSFGSDGQEQKVVCRTEENLLDKSGCLDDDEDMPSSMNIETFQTMLMSYFRLRRMVLTLAEMHGIVAPRTALNAGASIGGGDSSAHGSMGGGSQQRLIGFPGVSEWNGDNEYGYDGFDSSIGFADSSLMGSPADSQQRHLGLSVSSRIDRTGADVQSNSVYRSQSQPGLHGAGAGGGRGTERQQPPLPPVRLRQLQIQTMTKKAFKNAGYDASFTRATPRVLQSMGSGSVGGRAHPDIEALRMELQLAREGVKQLDRKVDDSIAWVQTNCDISSAASRFSDRTILKCRQMSIERLFEVFEHYLLDTLAWALHKWRSAAAYDNLLAQSKQISKLKGIELMTNTYYNAMARQLMKGFAPWVETVRYQRGMEIESATMELQRIGRGYLGRRRANDRKKLLAVIVIQNKLFRATKARMKVQRKRKEREERMRDDAVRRIQRVCADARAVQEAKLEVERRRRARAAVKIQKMHRGGIAREEVAGILSAKREQEQQRLQTEREREKEREKELAAALAQAIADEQAAAMKANEVEKDGVKGRFVSTAFGSVFVANNPSPPPLPAAGMVVEPGSPEKQSRRSLFKPTTWSLGKGTPPSSAERHGVATAGGSRSGADTPTARGKSKKELIQENPDYAALTLQKISRGRIARKESKKMLEAKKSSILGGLSSMFGHKSHDPAGASATGKESGEEPEREKTEPRRRKASHGEENSFFRSLFHGGNSKEAEKSATSIQKLARGKLARKQSEKIRQQRSTDSAEGQNAAGSPAGGSSAPSEAPQTEDRPSSRSSGFHLHVPSFHTPKLTGMFSSHSKSVDQTHAQQPQTPSHAASIGAHNLLPSAEVETKPGRGSFSMQRQAPDAPITEEGELTLSSEAAVASVADPTVSVLLPVRDDNELELGPEQPRDAGEEKEREASHEDGEGGNIAVEAIASVPPLPSEVHEERSDAAVDAELHPITDVAVKTAADNETGSDQKKRKPKSLAAADTSKGGDKETANAARQRREKALQKVKDAEEKRRLEDAKAKAARAEREAAAAAAPGGAKSKHQHQQQLSVAAGSGAAAVRRSLRGSRDSVESTHSRGSRGSRGSFDAMAPHTPSSGRGRSTPNSSRKAGGSSSNSSSSSKTSNPPVASIPVSPAENLARGGLEQDGANNRNETSSRAGSRRNSKEQQITPPLSARGNGVSAGARSRSGSRSRSNSRESIPPQTPRSSAGHPSPADTPKSSAGQSSASRQMPKHHQRPTSPGTFPGDHTIDDLARTREKSRDGHGAGSDKAGADGVEVGDGIDHAPSPSLPPGVSTSKALSQAELRSHKMFTIDENTATMRIQNSVRRFLAYRRLNKRKLDFWRAQNQAGAMIEWSTVTTQRIVRGKLGRKRYAEIKKQREIELQKKQEVGAARIQSIIRGKSGRNRANVIKQQKKELNWLKSYQKGSMDEAKPPKSATGSRSGSTPSSPDSARGKGEKDKQNKSKNKSSKPQSAAAMSALRADRAAGDDDDAPAEESEEVLTARSTKAIDEKIKKLEEIEANIKEREKKMMEAAKLSEERAEAMERALKLIEKRAQEDEADRLARNQLMQMAAGPISHRSPFASTGPRNNPPSGPPGAMGIGGSRGGVPPHFLHSARSSASRSHTPRTPKGGTRIMSTNGSQTSRTSVPEAPPTARSARGGAAVPPDAERMLYEGKEWVRLWDPDESWYYWYCEATQEAQWEEAGEGEGEGEGEDFYPAPSTAGGAESVYSDSGYESAGAMTDYSSDNYYEGNLEYSDSEFEGGSMVEWQEYWDEQAQAKYWYNNATGEASWTKPDSQSLAENSSVNSSRSVLTSSRAAAVGGHPNDWVSYLDDTTGQEYWYNAKTGETSWA